MKTNSYLLPGLLLALSVPTAAQSHFSIGLTAAPVLSHVSSRFSVSLPDQNGQLYQQTLDTKSTIGGYFVGVPVQYNITPKWSISSGLWFTQLRSTGDYLFSASGTSARIISSGYTVPLTVNYRPTTRRLSPYFSVGAVSSFQISTLYKPEAGTGLQDITLKFGKHAITVQALLGAGAAYRISPHWLVTAQPQLIWYFKPSGRFERYVSYRANGQVQVLYSF